MKHVSVNPTASPTLGGFGFGSKLFWFKNLRFANASLSSRFGLPLSFKLPSQLLTTSLLNRLSWEGPFSTVHINSIETMTEWHRTQSGKPGSASCCCTLRTIMTDELNVSGLQSTVSLELVTLKILQGQDQDIHVSVVLTLLSQKWLSLKTKTVEAPAHDTNNKKHTS